MHDKPVKRGEYVLASDTALGSGAEDSAWAKSLSPNVADGRRLAFSSLPLEGARQ